MQLISTTILSSSMCVHEGTRQFIIILISDMALVTCQNPVNCFIMDVQVIKNSPQTVEYSINKSQFESGQSFMHNCGRF